MPSDWVEQRPAIHNASDPGPSGEGAPLGSIGREVGRVSSGLQPGEPPRASWAQGSGTQQPMGQMGHSQGDEDR